MAVAATTGPVTTAVPGAPARGPGVPGEDEVVEIAERLAAYDLAEIVGDVGRTGPVTRAPVPGWAGARILHPKKNDWEPAVAADPNDPWVYVMVARHGSPVCPAARIRR